MEIKTKELAEMKSNISVVQKSADQLVVNTAEDMKLATVVLKDVSNSLKFITAKKKLITKPLMESLTGVRNLFKPLETSLDTAKKIIKEKMLSFTLEEQAKINKKIAQVEARVEKGTMKPETAANKLAEVPTMPKANIRVTTKINIVDESLIPREYLVPDMVAIKEAVKKGEIIPGVETSEEKSIVAR